MAEAVAHSQPRDAHVSPTTIWVPAAPGAVLWGRQGTGPAFQGFFCRFVFRQSKPLTQFTSGRSIAVRLGSPGVTALKQLWQKVASRRQELTLWLVPSKLVFSFMSCF